MKEKLSILKISPRTSSLIKFSIRPKLLCMKFLRFLRRRTLSLKNTKKVVKMKMKKWKKSRWKVPHHSKKQNRLK